MLRVVAWHGESGSLWYVMRVRSTLDWECVRTCCSRREAEHFVEREEGRRDG